MTLSPLKENQHINSKRALVLGGGGIPGWMYEIGVLTALDDFFDGFSVNQFDIYVGSSAGAAVAALMANGVKPKEIYDDIRADRKTRFNFTQKNIYSFGYHETWAMVKKSLRAFARALGYIFKAGRRVSLFEVLDILQEALPSGIFSLKNLDSFMEDFFSQSGFTNDFRKLRRELYIPAVDIDLGRYDVFGESPLDAVPISKAVMASSAIPILFQPVVIGDTTYVDGNVGRVAYMDIAMNHGADLMWVVNPVQFISNDRKTVCLPSLSDKGCWSIKDKGLSYVYDQAMRISTATRIYLAIKRYRLEYPTKQFILTEPRSSETVLFAHHPMSLDTKVQILEYGYRSTMNQLKIDFAYYEQSLAPYGIRARCDRFQRV